jgi:hypothetical protein
MSRKSDERVLKVGLMERELLYFATGVGREAQHLRHNLHFVHNYGRGEAVARQSFDLVRPGKSAYPSQG